MRAVSDEQLIEWVANGDSSCLGTLFERYHTGVYQFCVRMTRNPHHAEDVVQETFLTAWRTRDSFRGDLSERNWLYMILKSRIIDLVRKRQTKQKSFVETENAGEDMFTEGGHWKPESAPSAWPADSMDHAEKFEFQEIFSMCLDRLADRHRLVFVSKEVEGNESEEVC